MPVSAAPDQTVRVIDGGGPQLGTRMIPGFGLGPIEQNSYSAQSTAINLCAWSLMPQPTGYRSQTGDEYVHLGFARSAAWLVALLMVCIFGSPKPCLAQDMATVIPYPRVPGDRPDPDFPSVRVNGIAVDTVRTDMNVGYTHFAFSGTVTVEVVVRRPIGAFDLSPHRYGIDAITDGSVLIFRLSQPRKLHLRVDDLPRFFIFADAPEKDAPELGQPGVRDIRDYGVYDSLDAVQTTAIQRAIDDAARDEGVLYIPPGSYRAGELRLRSGLSVYLAPGAVLRGSGDVSDYPRGELGTQQIYLLDCHGVRITGRGVIDGQGRALRLSADNSTNSRMKLIRSLRAENCAVTGVILRDAGTWSVHLVESNDIRFANYKLLSNAILDDPGFPWEPNTDGFDPDNSSRVIIEDGFVSCSDDAIAVKLKFGALRDMTDIAFRRNVVWTVKSALKIGTEVRDHRVVDVAFEDNDVIHADRGIAVYCYRGATVESATWVGNHFEHIGGDIKQMNVEIKIPVSTAVEEWFMRAFREAAHAVGG